MLNINQDIVLGNYYLTYAKPCCSDWRSQKSSLRAATRKWPMTWANSCFRARFAFVQRVKFAKRPFGRLFFNEILPEDFPYNNNVQNKKELKKFLPRSSRSMAQRKRLVSLTA